VENETAPPNMEAMTLKDLQFVTKFTEVIHTLPAAQHVEALYCLQHKYSASASHSVSQLTCCMNPGV